jgi:allantoate deiminase
VAPGAVNVIPGLARLSLDIRSSEDADRVLAVSDILGGIEAICKRRGLRSSAAQTHESRAVACSPSLMTQLESAVAAQGVPSLRLPSGAGHDAMALADLTQVGMLFVRCQGGISHNPAESITMADAELGARALLHFVRNFTPKENEILPHSEFKES